MCRKNKLIFLSLLSLMIVLNPGQTGTWSLQEDSHVLTELQNDEREGVNSVSLDYSMYNAEYLIAKKHPYWNMREEPVLYLLSDLGMMFLKTDNKKMVLHKGAFKSLL